MLRVALVLILAPILLLQVRRPSRGIGRLFLWAMNVSHSRMTDWALTHVDIAKSSTILDVGCGGGRTIQKMAATASDGVVHGVDYSAESVAVSRATNAASIEAGRVHIDRASVSQLPFADGTFDLVTSIESHYYWRDLVKDLQGIRRVLKPGATLMIAAECYKGGAFGWLQQIVMTPLGGAFLSAEEYGRLFAAAGYSDVEVFQEAKRGWLCAVGKNTTRVLGAGTGTAAPPR
jgi:SAM-dependent methyltransferase